jgi:hypothetical protein
MNKNIERLAEQAWDEISVSDDFGHPISFAERLSELIIKECLDCVELIGKTDLHSWSAAGAAIKIDRHIKQHFGVKE